MVLLKFSFAGFCIREVGLHFRPNFVPFFIINSLGPTYSIIVQFCVHVCVCGGGVLRYGFKEKIR